MNFYPRPPRGGRQYTFSSELSTMLISIHALREEGDIFTTTGSRHFKISIHALREEGDLFLCHVYSSVTAISIHALREEGDLCVCTPSKPERYFYPRPPRGGRPYNPVLAQQRVQISIHALREEGDVIIFLRGTAEKRFLSTPSARRATEPRWTISHSFRFLSTPSARRATMLQSTIPAPPTNFYPRPPRGGRHFWGQQVSVT